jgi:hemerythrin
LALQWSSALSLGVEDLDVQHRELFERVDHLLDAMLRKDRTEAARLSAYLCDHVGLHFAAEEQLMRDLGFPEVERHAAEHRAFANSMCQLNRAFSEQGPTAEVVAWLRDHVYVSDVELGRFIRVRLPLHPSQIQALAQAGSRPDTA